MKKGPEPMGSGAPLQPSPSQAAAPPRTWLVLGDKLGDNAQVDAVAAALGWPVERRQLRFLPQYRTGKPPFRASLYHLDREGSDPLAPPWPDLVLTVGRRPSMAAMWIKAQSGERTRVVIVGRPRRMLGRFDLVLAPPQYRLPDRSNVLHLELPLMRVDEGAVAKAAADWREELDGLPRPLTAVLVGGPTKPFIFDAGVARTLVSGIRTSTGDRGSLFVTTSRRTPDDVVAALENAVAPPSRLFRWRADAPANPYLALLGLADRFVVTGDSISMIVEVARLGKPLAIFALPVRRGLWTGIRRRLAARFQPLPGGGGENLLTKMGDAVYELGLIGYAREFAALHRRLIDRGLAVPLGQPFANGAAAADDLPEVVNRIQALFAGGDPKPAPPA
jgi:mitochondrial fission protein ELM1